MMLPEVDRAAATRGFLTYNAARSCDMYAKYAVSLAAEQGVLVAAADDFLDDEGELPDFEATRAAFLAVADSWDDEAATGGDCDAETGSRLRTLSAELRTAVDLRSDHELAELVGRRFATVEFMNLASGWAFAADEGEQAEAAWWSQEAVATAAYLIEAGDEIYSHLGLPAPTPGDEQKS